MLTTLKNAFKVKEIKERILFTLFILVVVRLGAQLPIPRRQPGCIQCLVCGSDRGSI